MPDSHRRLPINRSDGSGMAPHVRRSSFGTVGLRSHCETLQYLYSGVRMIAMTVFRRLRLLVLGDFSGGILVSVQCAEERDAGGFFDFFFGAILLTTD